jgi:chromate transporter
LGEGQGVRADIAIASGYIITTMRPSQSPDLADRPTSTDAASVAELAFIFLKLGTTAFGGPAAHIAMMKAEFVERRGWLTDAEFLDLIGASNLIPGPSSTEVAIHIGLRRAGWIGLLLAGLCFILPAALIVTGIAWAYVRFGSLPRMHGVLYGIKPVVIAVVAQALWSLGRTALKTRLSAFIASVATVLGFLGGPPLVLLFGAGSLLGLIARMSKSRFCAPPGSLPFREGVGVGKSPSGCGAGVPARESLPFIAIAAGVVLLVGIPLLATMLEPREAGAVHLPALFLVFAKIGTVVYGSGYVLLAFLRTDLVTRLHWLTTTRLLDAVAVGQFTPGPVFTTATFIGYLMAGPKGAAVATVGIFLPSFILVALSGPLIPRIRRSPMAGAFLDGVNAAALALMAVVTWQLARAALVDVPTVALCLVSAIFLFRTRVNSAWLVLAGALVGVITRS